MLETQVFQAFGLAYLAIGLGILINPGFYKKIMASLSEQPMSVYFAGALAFVVGFLLVTFFNVWEWSWSLVITILGWLSLVKGMLLFLFPKAMVNMASSCKKGMMAKGIIVLIIGIVLALLGFSVI